MMPSSRSGRVLVGRRCGAIIPVVVLALVVMAILGTWLMWQSTSAYAQMTRVAAGLHARETLSAAMDEARALAYDRLNRTVPLPPAPGQPERPPVLSWHADLLAALRRAGAAVPRGVLARYDLKPALAATRALAAANATELTSASAELLAFKRLSLDSRGIFEDSRIYYRDERRVLDPPDQEAKLAPPVEWVGSLRLRVAVKSGTTIRTLSQVLDVKVVDVNAPAREFVLFSYLSSARGQDHGPESDDYFRNDLRRGGAMHVFGGGAGRIFVRGPFLVDTVGWTGGTGGRVPQRQTSSNQNTEWWGWGVVPATRDGIVARGGPAIVNFGMPPMRPNSTGTWRAFTGLVAGRFGSAWTDWFNDDPGYYIKDGQRWYCESQSSDGSVFSIFGKAGQLDTFKGLLWLYGNRDRRPVGLSDRFARGSVVLHPTDDDSRYVIEPEGGLYALYNVVRYTGDSYAFDAYQRYRIRFLQQVQGRLGLHWEKKYTTSWLEQFVTDLLRGPAIFGSAGLIPAMLLPRSIAEAVAVTLLSFVGINTRPGALSELARITPAQLDNALPPRYRPPARSVTRRYRRFSELPGQKRRGVPLVMDGIVAFDELDGALPFWYAGRGVIYSESPRAQTLVGPIVPARAGDREASLVIHHEGPAARAHRAEAMLNLRMEGRGNPVIASIYATQGLRTSASARIDGNLVCGFLNKSQLPAGTSLDLHYRRPPVLDPISAVSFRASVVLDR